MKNIITILAVIIFSTTGFCQFHNHNVTLTSSELFIEITLLQMIDSVNLNQTGGNQWEYLRFGIKGTDVHDTQNKVNRCKSINDIINTFGEISLDISVMSATDNIIPLSGFYYSIDKERLILEIIYPRRDILLY